MNVTTRAELSELRTRLRREVAAGRAVGWDTEWDAPTIEHRGKRNPDGLRARLVGYSVAVRGGVDGYYVPIRANGWEPPEGFEADARRLLRLLEDPRVRVFAHNVKGELHVLANEGIVPTCEWLDSEILCWLAGWRLPGKGGLKLKSLVEVQLGYRGATFEDVASGRAASALTLAEIGPYAARDAVLTLALGRKAAGVCADLGLTGPGSCWELDRACIPVTAELERTGVRLDEAGLFGHASRCEAGLGVVADEFRALTTCTVMLPTKVREHMHCEGCGAGVCITPGCVGGMVYFKNGKPCMRTVTRDVPTVRGADPGNDRQVSRWLFDELKLWPTTVGGKPYPKTANGWSVAEEDIRPFTALPGAAGLAARLRLRYQALRKYSTTYTRSLVHLARQTGDGRLHGTYRQDGTDTSRFSSSRPNQQNLPSSERLNLPWLENLPDIRRAFRTDPGWVLVVRDFSQVELRIVAHYSQDPTMLKLYREGGDIHANTMAKVGIPRRPAKTYNFSIIYRISAPRLRVKTALATNDWSKSVAGTQTEIDAWYATYPGVVDMHEDLIRRAERNRYAETLTGFKRPLLAWSGRGRWGTENQAINTPIQGTAGGLIKRAMVELHRAWVGAGVYGSKVRWVSQVHDELIVEAREDYADVVNVDMGLVMAHCAPELTVPLTSSGGIGPSWAEAKDG